jgi:hypothetical protein
MMRRLRLEKGGRGLWMVKRLKLQRGSRCWGTLAKLRGWVAGLLENSLR